MAHLSRDGSHIGQVRPMAGAVAVQESCRVRRWQHHLRRLGPATRAGPGPGHRLACTAQHLQKRALDWLEEALRRQSAAQPKTPVAAAWRMLLVLHANRMALYCIQRSCDL